MALKNYTLDVIALSPVLAYTFSRKEECGDMNPPVQPPDPLCPRQNPCPSPPQIPCHIPCEPGLLRREYERGLSYKAIAEKYGMDQRTAKRYVEGNLPLADYQNRPYRSILDPYKGIIRGWLQEQPAYSSDIYQKLRQLGFPGSYNLVNRYVQKVMRELEASGRYSPSAPRIRQTAPVPDAPALTAPVPGAPSAPALSGPPALSIRQKIQEEEKYAADQHR